MRKNYVKPTLTCEKFITQEYCGVCKQNGVTTYSASCDTSGYVFKDTNGNHTFDNGTDEYLNYNTAGDDCGFNIDYWPTNKNAFIVEVPKGTQIWENENKGTIKPEYAASIKHGYRIETPPTYMDWDGDSHFIYNLNSNTITPNIS